MAKVRIEYDDPRPGAARVWVNDEEVEGITHVVVEHDVNDPPKVTITILATDLVVNA